MTTQAILMSVNDALAAIANQSSPYAILAELRNNLEAQVRSEIASSKGVGNALKTVVAVLKRNEQARKALAFPWIDAEGRQCCCDGFVAFRLRDHLPFPERPEDAGKPIDLDRIFPASTAGYKALPMPSAKELRSFIAIERAKSKTPRNHFTPIWDFGPEAPSVNALYLLDAATVFPNAATILWNTLASPLVIDAGEAGDGLVLPIRVEGKTQPKPATDEERKAVEAEEQRRETIRKAQADCKAAWEEATKAQFARHEALEHAETAKRAHKDLAKGKGDYHDDQAYKAAIEQYYKASEAEASARLRKYAAETILDPEFDLLPSEFEYIITLQNIRSVALPKNAA